MATDKVAQAGAPGDRSPSRETGRALVVAAVHVGSILSTRAAERRTSAASCRPPRWRAAVRTGVLDLVAQPDEELDVAPHRVVLVELLPQGAGEVPRLDLTVDALEL